MWREWPFVGHAAGSGSVRQPIKCSCWTYRTCLAVTPGLPPHKPPTLFPTTLVLYTQYHTLIWIVPHRPAFLSVILLSPSYTFCSSLSFGFNFAFLHVQKFFPVSHFRRLPISIYFLVRSSFLYSFHIYSSKMLLILCLCTHFHLPSH